MSPKVPITVLSQGDNSDFLVSIVEAAISVPIKIKSSLTVPPVLKQPIAKQTFGLLKLGNFFS